MENQEKIKQIKTGEAVAAYNVLKELNISTLERDDMLAVLRATRSLKPVATGLEEFVADARERLKPDGFEDVENKMAKFATLPLDERQRIESAYRKYQKDLDDCVARELETEKEIDYPLSLSEGALPVLIAGNKQLTVESIILIEDLCR